MTSEHRRLRVCLVRPPTRTSVGAAGQDAVPPIGVAYVAAALRSAGYEVRAVDAVGEAVHQYSRPTDDYVLLHGLGTQDIVERVGTEVDVVGVSCMFSVDWPMVRELLAALRKALPQALIVVGGEHITACPEFTLESCKAIDIGVLGEGEETIVELLGAYAARHPLEQVAGLILRNGAGLVRSAARKRIRAIDDIPRPAWDLLPVRAYIDNALTHGANLGRCMPILASRGCPYRCTFCSSPLMWTTLWSARDPRAVVAEMKQYMQEYEVTNFDFYDLTAIVKRDWIVEFCRLLIAENLGITWQLPSGTRSEAIDAEVARLLVAAGCRIVNYAPESGSPAELARLKKKVDPQRMLESMRSAHRAGIVIKANFVFGFPHSTWRDVGHTFAFLAQLAWIGIEDINAFPFSPYPGSELFRELAAAAKLRLDDEYFHTMLAYTDPQHSVSYCELVGSRGLSMLNLAAMFYFYALSFTFRPQRALRLILALLTNDTSSKLTMALAHRRRKRTALRLAQRTAQQTVTIAALDRPRNALPRRTVAAGS